MFHTCLILGHTCIHSYMYLIQSKLQSKLSFHIFIIYLTSLNYIYPTFHINLPFFDQIYLSFLIDVLFFQSSPANDSLTINAGNI